MPETRFHEMPDGRRIAYRFVEGHAPAWVFLPGYMSDMAGGKASAVMARAEAEGRACLLLDYSGCGESSGDFADGTLTRWHDEVMALLEALTLTDVVLAGSSMGGWLMLLVALAAQGKVRGLVGIAAAPDFTDWGTSEADKARLAGGETVYEDNPYGPDPTPTHPGFWQDGEANRLLGDEIAFDGPVRLLQGQADEVVPWRIALDLAAALRSAAVQVVLIKDGDHRLSRDADIDLLLAALASLD